MTWYHDRCCVDKAKRVLILIEVIELHLPVVPFVMLHKVLLDINQVDESLLSD